MDPDSSQGSGARRPETSARRRQHIRWLVLGAGVLVVTLAILWPRRAHAPRNGSTPTAPDTRYPDVPRIDVHVHVAPSEAKRAVELLGAQHIEVGLNASGGAPGLGFEQAARIAKQTQGRLRPYCNLRFAGVERDGWNDYVVKSLETCKRLGAVGLKIFQSLGLGIRLADGRLLHIDDPRLDIVFETAGKLGLPVLIDSGGPKAFFQPPTPDNERYAELQAHPGWSYYGPRADGVGNWPSWNDIFTQFKQRVARHPNTVFIGAHFGNDAEDPDEVAHMLDAHPKYFIGTAARVPEIGRHSPERMRRFFERYQDRILFGSDFMLTSKGPVLGSSGKAPDTIAHVPFFFRAQWRYFETRDRHIASPTPIQGAWSLDGVGLPRSVLEKIYWRNAARVFGIALPRHGKTGPPAQTSSSKP